ncbi:MAG: twin-arginine translocase TatA/TatE family subunit, partial [Actinomycetota bacterium]|nr:twin-arginine translocase TatA/TatE family subunit [Actinomycetota bacterium]
MARAVGQSARIFKDEIKGTAADEHTRVQHEAPAASLALEQPPHSLAPAPLNAPPDHGIPSQPLT